MPERQTPLLTIQEARTPEITDGKGNQPLIYHFLMDCVKSLVYLSLDERTKKLIGTYWTTPATLDDLKPLAQVTTRQAVQKIIERGFTKMWRQIAPELQSQYPLEDVLTSLKPTFSKETRAKMSAAHKGKTLSPETRAKMSAAHKKWWGEQRLQTNKLAE